MSITKPISESIVAKGHTPLYSVHRYFARRPHNVFRNLIEHYLEEPGVILDPFTGGGVTLIEGLTNGHKVIGHEINPVACFINEKQLTKVDVDALEHALFKCLDYCENKVGFTYKYGESDVYWYSWESYTFCHHCNQKTVLNPETTSGSGVYICQSCSKKFRPKRVSKHNIEPTAICTMEGELNKFSTHVGTINGTFLKKHHNTISEQLNKSGYTVKKDEKTKIPKCNLEKESSLHNKDFTHFEDFVTQKNQAWVMCFAEAIKTVGDPNLREVLYFILSASLRYTSRFSSLNSKWRKGHRPLEWAKSNFWTPYAFIELNPKVAIFERYKAVIAAQKDFDLRFGRALIHGSPEEVINGKAELAIVNKPSQHMNGLPGESVDLILTDPPYGSYLNYGELTGFWQCWLSKIIPEEIDKFSINKHEAVVSRKKHEDDHKSFTDYENELAEVFSEAYRVLKDQSYMVFTFNNKEPEAWLALLRAIKKAGFILPAGGVVFQDGVEAYKRTIALRREGAIHGDFIYSFLKDTSKANSSAFGNSDFDWEETVQGIIDGIFSSKDSISNTDLYLEINKELLPQIYNHLDPNGLSTGDLLSFNFKNLEALINKNLHFDEGSWKNRF